jgi:predicted GNAT family N-acyltransferase
MHDITIRLAEMPIDFPGIQAVRYSVFQLEQGVSAELEFDGQDETAIHFIALMDSQVVGTARVRFLGDNLAKIERLAVLQEARGSGTGRALMEKALKFLTERQVAEVLIHAQAYLKGFYESLGFVPEGELFEEAGIPHVKMRKRLVAG